MISVIITAHNPRRFLEETLDSVFSQKNAEFEVLVVGDGSSDNSLSAMKKYKNIRLLHPAHKGSSEAKNLGLQEAKGEFVLFLDTGDTLCQGALKKMEDLAKNNDLVTGNYNVMDESGIITEKEVCLFHEHDRLSFFHMPPLLGAKLFKKEILLNFGIEFEPFRIGQDLNFYLKYLVVCRDIGVIKEPLINHRVPDQIVDDRVFEIDQSINNALDFARHLFKPALFEALSEVQLIHYQEQFLKYKNTKDKALQKKIFWYFGKKIKKLKIFSDDEYLLWCRKNVIKQMRLFWFYLYT